MSVDGEFKRLTAKDRLCAAVLKAVRENDTAALRRLGLGGFAQYAGRLSELMTASVRGGLDWSPDFAALMRQVNSPVRYAHHLVNECGTAVQTALDERNGLRLRVVQPDYNDGRTKAIVGEAAESDSENAADNLATQLGTEVKDAGNVFLKQNAEQRSGAGFKVTVERTGGTNCCPWCADRIGRWELKDAPKDVFGCHDNCTCMVEYTSSRGVRSQRLGRSRFVEVNYEPKRLTDGEKRGAGEPKRLTGGVSDGIISAGAIEDKFKQYVPNREERKQIIAQGISAEKPIFDNGSLAKYYQYVDKEDGYYDIVMHGKDDCVQFYDRLIDYQTLGAIILGRSDYKQGTPIRLFSCSTGKGDDSFAKHLSEMLKAEVKAPNQDIHVGLPVDGHSKYYIGSEKHKHDGDWIYFGKEYAK